MATKLELEMQVEQLKAELKQAKDEDKMTEVAAMISLWAVKLESVERSADHPFSIIKEVVESMKNYLGV